MAIVLAARRLPPAERNRRRVIGRAAEGGHVVRAVRGGAIVLASIGSSEIIGRPNLDSGKMIV